MSVEIKLLELIDGAAQEILAAKHSNHHRDKFFPKLINSLGYKTAAEIGVDTGGFSLHLLSSDLEKLYCIDTWQDDFGSDHKPDYYDADGNNRFKEAMLNLEEHIKSNRAIPMRGKSVDISKNFEDESLDFVYIDGDHSLFGIYEDMFAWVPKVKVGGVIAGHDYKDGPKSGIKDFFGEQLPYRIKSVTDNFCRKYGYINHEVGGRILSFYFVKNRSM